jgi:hypothetical protein
MRYNAPSYQRPYVWRHAEDEPEDDRLGPFWDDVKQTVERLVEHERLLKAAGDPDKLAPMTPHFFGAVVVGEPEKGGGGIVMHEVIDGQQRLTTAQLLIAAAARACDERGRTTHASRLRRLWLQDEDVEVKGDDRLKLRPTRHDRKAFGITLDPKATKFGGLDRVSAGYAYFAACLAEWIKDLPTGQETEHFDALRDTIYDHLLFVMIELQPGDNPQGIFESLNAQGERLLAIDLVKNQVFRRARRAELDLERLDTEVWSPRFGEEWWRVAVKQGRYQRPRAELFLMHWLTERTEREISATGLFVEFSRLFGSERVEIAEVESFVHQFIADAGTYREFELLAVGSRERLFFKRREVIDVGVIFPVALRLWRDREERKIDDARLVIGLRALESWLVRRMTMRLTGKNYNRLVLELLKSMSAPNADPVVGLIRQLRSFPASSPSSWWPADKDFRSHLVEQALYGTLSQPRVRLLLEAVEARMHTPKTETISVPEKLTIEHVIPQTWEETWPLPSPHTSELLARRTAAIHRLGNLTLATSSLNPAMSNDPWAEKRTELALHSALRLNANLIHEHPTTFDEDCIDQRGTALADLIIAEWPGPDAAEWV